MEKELLRERERRRRRWEKKEGVRRKQTTKTIENVKLKRWEEVALRSLSDGVWGVSGGI